MKTLINKANPAIRITAPDGMVKNRTNCWAIWSEGNRLMLLDKDNWALVEEEPVQEEICSKCVYHKKDDGYCYNPYGGMRRRINENGVCECTGFCEKVGDLLAKMPPAPIRFEPEPKKLTWKEVQRLYLIWREVSNELDACSKNFPKWSSSTRDMFEEILKRFYEGDDGQK